MFYVLTLFLSTIYFPKKSPVSQTAWRLFFLILKYEKDDIEIFDSFISAAADKVRHFLCNKGHFFLSSLFFSLLMFSGGVFLYVRMLYHCTNCKTPWEEIDALWYTNRNDLTWQTTMNCLLSQYCLSSKTDINLYKTSLFITVKISGGGNIQIVYSSKTSDTTL